jgi:hypothetical protein
MSKSAAAVKIGPAHLYVAAVGATFPAVTAAPAGGTWTDMGYSEEGFTFEIENTIEEVRVAQSVDPIDVKVSDRSVRITGELSQSSLANLDYVTGGAGATASASDVTTFTPTANNAIDHVTNFAILLRAAGQSVASSGKHRDYQVPVAVFAGAQAINYQKAPQKATYLVEIHALVVTDGATPFVVLDDEA